MSSLICSMQNCSKTSEKHRNVCAMHRSRFKKHGSYELPEAQPLIEICCVEGCDKPRAKRPDGSFKGLRCTTHRARWQKYKSDELPDRTKPTEGIVKTCKIHGDLTINDIYIQQSGQHKNSRYRKDYVWYQCKQCQSDRNSKGYIKHNRRIDVHERDLFKNYGMTREDYEYLVYEQDNLCAICNEPETAMTKNGEPRTLGVDHCHDTKIIRGLLCSRCNMGIGLFKESIPVLEGVLKYLKKWNTPGK